MLLYLFLIREIKPNNSILAIITLAQILATSYNNFNLIMQIIIIVTIIINSKLVIIIQHKEFRALAKIEKV